MISSPQAKLNPMISHMSIPKVQFTNESVTAYGGLSLFKTFQALCGWDEILKRLEQKVFTLNRCTPFTVSKVVDEIIDSTVVGQFRVSYMDRLRWDPGLRRITGSVILPSERTIRRRLKAATSRELRALLDANQELLQLKASLQGPREIDIDIDDSVCEVYGKQEGSMKGYNPRKHGGRSYKERYAFVAGSKELIYAQLNPGNYHSNTEFKDFFRLVEKSVPDNWFIRRIRADRAFPDDEILAYFEERTYSYVIKAKYTSRLKKVVEYLDQHDLWEEVQDGLYTAELRIPLTNWEKARRFVFIRQRPVLKDPNNPEQINMFELSYEWNVQAIVTNEEDMTPVQVWQCYNGRTGIENLIEEGKNSYAMDVNAHHDFRVNEIIFTIRMLAYNWVNWFKQSVLPEEDNHWELKTMRENLMNIPANVHGTHRKMNVNYPSFPPIEKRIRAVTSNLSNLKSTLSMVRLVS